jgi:hypothetical protein
MCTPSIATLRSSCSESWNGRSDRSDPRMPGIWVCVLYWMVLLNDSEGPDDCGVLFVTFIITRSCAVT